MSTATHPVTPEEVMAFLDGELSAAAAQSISTHVDHCAECTTLAQQFRSTSQSLSRWDVEPVPTKLEDTITDLAIKTPSGLNIGNPNIFIRASFWNWKQWTAGLGATAAALLLLLAIATPHLMRAKMAANEASAIARQRAQQTESYSGSIGKLQAGSQPITDQFQSETAPRSSPRFAADSNALFHALGDRVEPSFTVDPMIARVISLSLVTKDFVASRASLDAILARRRGYSAQLTVSTAENAPRSLQASLRIPAPELSSAVADLKSLGRVENESQSGEEVTQQHADLVARLKNSRETEQRLQAILTQRTGKISDVLAVEKEIARVRGEIEEMEAEQKNLEHRVDFATINLQLTEEYKAQLNPPATSIATRIHNAFVAGLHNVSESVLGILLFFFEDGPTLLLWLLIFLTPAWFLWRRYRRSLAAA